MTCPAPGHERPVLTLPDTGRLRVQLLDVRYCSGGSLEAVLDASLYVIAGVTRQLPAVPAVYVGETGTPGAARWEVSLRDWTTLRRQLRAQWVFLIVPVDGWEEEDRLLTEAHSVRSILDRAGGVHVLNTRTAAPRAWRALSPARRRAALEHADTIAAAVAAYAFPGRTGGGLAASSGGSVRDAWVRLLYQRSLPATQQDLAAEARIAGLSVRGLTPLDSQRVDLAKREMRTGRPRIRKLHVAGRMFYAPVAMPRTEMQRAAAAQRACAAQVADAVHQALVAAPPNIHDRTTGLVTGPGAAA